MNGDPCPTWEMCSDDHCQKFRKCMTVAWAEYYGVPHSVPALATATGTAKTAKPVECEASQSGPEWATPNPLKDRDHD